MLDIAFDLKVWYNKDMKKANNTSVNSSNTSTTAPGNPGGKLTTGPIDKDLAKRVAEKITSTRIKALIQQPFFGTLIVRQKIVSADAWLPTMAVDGKYLYFNHEFVDMLDIDELLFVFSHEILHLAYDHIGRRFDRNPRLHNVAADYVVNDALIEAGIGKFPTTVEGLHDIKYRGWSSEEVYDDLLKNQEKMSEDQFNKAIDDMFGKLLDAHLGTGDGPGSDDDGENASSDPSAQGPAKYSKEDRKQISEEMKQQLVTAAKLSQGIGTIPVGMQRLIQDLTEPKMDWRTLLQCTLNSIIPCDYSYMQVNRKGWDLEAILPGMVTEKQLSIAVAIDTSGSISQAQATEFLSEVKGIMDQYAMYEIDVFTFDTKCYGLRKFTSDNTEDIRTYEVLGGGGTDGGAIFRFLKEENMEPIKLVIFTDGRVGDFGDPNYCDTVWIIKGSNVVPPFGVHAYFDEEKN